MTTDVNDDPYFQEHLSLGKLGFNQEVRLMLHSSTESYSRNYQELFGRLPGAGQRNYYHARPYLTPRTSPPPVSSTACPVLDTGGQALGNIQAWYYPVIRTAMIWEVELFDPYRQDNPLEDPLLAALWGAFEGLVLDRNPGVLAVYTPNWEPVYELKYQEFQQFVERQGYRASTHHQRLMMKEV